MTRASQPKGNDSSGFTLIEVMVASLLLLMVLLPMSALLASAVRAAVVTENQNAAAMLAQEQIEEMRSLNFDSLALNASLIGVDSGITGTNPYYFSYEGTTYQVAADIAGTVEPVSTNVPRRKAVFAIKRYVLLTADPVIKKLVVHVSWTNPTAGEMTFETDYVKVGSNLRRPPNVIISYPYIGEAFTRWEEISNTSFNSLAGPVTAIARDADGQPQQASFQFKKNIDAAFSSAGVDVSGTNVGDGYEFSISWDTALNSQAQYNLRVSVTDNDAQVGIVTQPVFIDLTPPLAPGSLTVTDLTGATGSPITWPFKLRWAPVYDYIDSNQNFNMVIGYLVYRDERVGTDDSTLSTSLVAALDGSEVAGFVDSTPMDAVKQYRYRVKSMGRARAWRTTRLSEVVSESQSTWFAVSLPATGDAFTTFTTPVVAQATSWSAVRLSWPRQQDAGGHYADQYLIWRSPGFDESSAYSLVATVTDPGTEVELVYEDTNLKRNTSYAYQVQPVATPEYLNPSSIMGVSNSVTTNIY